MVSANDTLDAGRNSGVSVPRARVDCLISERNAAFDQPMLVERGCPRPTDGALRPQTSRQNQKVPAMIINLTSIQPIIALAAGIAILIVPRLLNYIVAGYLILTGLIGFGIINL